MKILLEDRTYQGLINDFGRLGFRRFTDMEDEELDAVIEAYKRDHSYNTDDISFLLVCVSDDLEWAWINEIKNRRAVWEAKEYKRDMQASWDKERSESMNIN